jgi:hypothetical protein
MIAGCTMTDMSQPERKKYGLAPERAVRMESWALGGIVPWTIIPQLRQKLIYMVQFKADYSVEN